MFYWTLIYCYAIELPIFIDYVYTAYYWIILGVLSSVGLGSGLHTFLIFVLPYIGYIDRKIKACGNSGFSFPPLAGLRVFLPTGEHIQVWSDW